MRILFIQLPLADHNRGYINANVEYAPALLSGYINTNFPGNYCETLPNVLSSLCSDELIITYIENLSFDMVCFTSYLWNIERNLAIALKIKERNSTIQIFFGGPEIAYGSIALNEHQPFVNGFVSGEGEWFFEQLFRDDQIEPVYVNGNPLFIQPASELIDPLKIIEPLSSRRLNTMPGGSVFIEMTRGCPYRCSYCYYSKNFSRVREIPFNTLTQVLQNPGAIEEIYLLSPAFDRSPQFREKLIELKGVNPGIKLHTEIRTDRIDPETARLMYEAGFASLEVGLQSLNRRSLENVCRDSDTAKELQGMEYLKDAGIELKIGIIPGLPGDTPESFKLTVDTLVDHGFGDSIELYPLMILPGTVIRDRGEAEDISFLRKPPYFYHEGWGFTFSDIKDITSYVEARTGLSQSSDSIPDFTDSPDPLYIKGVRFKSDDFLKWNPDLIIKRVHTLVTDLHISITDASSFYRGFEKFAHNPPVSRLYNVIAYGEEPLDEGIILEIIASAEKDNFNRRLHIYNSYRDGSIFHFYQVFTGSRGYRTMQERSNFIKPVFALTGENSSELENIDPASSSLLIHRGVYAHLKEILTEDFSENPSSLSFIDESEMEEFYKDSGIVYSAYPYSFGIIDL